MASGPMDEGSEEMQKLVTKAIEGKAPALYETDIEGRDPFEAVAVAHYFSVFNGWDWYMTEYDPASRMAYGFVNGLEGEFGYFSIAEFEQANKAAGFELIERDAYWRPRRLSDIDRIG